MTGNITWEMILGLITIVGFVGGVWWRIEGRINSAADVASMTALAAKTKAEIASDSLQAYKLHVAETYTSKDDVNREFEAVSKTITEVGERMEKRLDGINERLDRVIEAGQKSSSRRTP